MWQWLISDGWPVWFLILNIVLVLFVCASQLRQNTRIWRIEHQIKMVLDRIVIAHNRIDTVNKRLTGEFSPEDFTNNKTKKKR